MYLLAQHIPSRFSTQNLSDSTEYRGLAELSATAQPGLPLRDTGFRPCVYAARGGLSSSRIGSIRGARS